MSSLLALHVALLLHAGLALPASNLGWSTEPPLSFPSTLEKRPSREAANELPTEWTEIQLLDRGSMNDFREVLPDVDW